ncbi:hypothetical protein BIW11_13304 [Tropilaelaps mercedesae]|uniref:Uncharacterized protein n=1 Tax=Tropilaelaps mercedesae TaxID=418985 RepID=A0A1V9X2E1_9ACAR|nr:hypothetical protein BIW11_13304 [Tropilaelaps mercedesae]
MVKPWKGRAKLHVPSSFYRNGPLLPRLRLLSGARASTRASVWTGGGP